MAALDRDERRRNRELLLLMRAAQATEEGFSEVWEALGEGAY